MLTAFSNQNSETSLLITAPILMETGFELMVKAFSSQNAENILISKLSS